MCVPPLSPTLKIKGGTKLGKIIVCVCVCVFVPPLHFWDIPSHGIKRIGHDIIKKHVPVTQFQNN